MIKKVHVIINIDKIPKIIIKKSEEVRGPSIDASDEAKKGFIRSHKIDQKQIYEKKNEKGTFYFFMKSSEKVNTYDLLKKNLPNILGNISKMLLVKSNYIYIILILVIVNYLYKID